MAAGFGRKSGYFSNLLKVLSSGDNENETGTDLESARNLFYVAVTRATKNLSIIYSNEIEDQNPVKDVFGDIKTSLELGQ
jgi:superfamily I DNA/RNA helicase